MKEALLSMWAILAYVKHRAGTLSMDEKMYLINLVRYIALNPNKVTKANMASLPFMSSLSGVNDQYFSSSIPSMVMADAISRNVNGVLGNAQSLDMESYENSLLEAPSFTKPENFENLSVIKEFLKGNHSKIASLKNNLAICKTKYYRPNLVKNKKTQ